MLDEVSGVKLAKNKLSHLNSKNALAISSISMSAMLIYFPSLPHSLQMSFASNQVVKWTIAIFWKLA